MLWDLFCRVIDNFGDMGVCWRLATDLGQRGHQVRLWVDDPSALQWMAPHVAWRDDPILGLRTGQGQPQVTVCHWSDAAALPSAHPLVPGDVVIEAFGCELPEAFVARMQRPVPPQWVNLEYLSAEDYVERSHGLYSPVWHGPGAGLRKRFFYPGFTAATGGLLREPDLVTQRSDWDDDKRQAWLRSQGVAWHSGDRVVSVFCYANAPLPALLDHLASSPSPDGSQRPTVTHVLLAHGHATQLGLAWQDDAARGPARRSAVGGSEAPALCLHALPALPQSEFDCLLWSADLNFVRGEDSAVRALWAGRPHVWQIYEQDDGVHAGKLQAFIDRWMAQWPRHLREEVEALWRGWNALSPMPPTLPDWQGATSEWAQHTLIARAKLSEQTDLSTQLIHFVTQAG